MFIIICIVQQFNDYLQLHAFQFPNGFQDFYGTFE